MNANYSEALEQQMALSRWVTSASGNAWFVNLNAVGGAEAGEGWTATAIRKIVAFPLEHGATYWWAPATVALIEHATKSVPDFRLDPSLLPSGDGFAWLGTHPERPSALLWTTLTPNDEVPCVHITPVLWNEKLARLLPVGPVRWRAGQLISEAEEDYKNLALAMDRTLVSQNREANAAAFSGYLLRQFGAMLLFLNQRLLVASHQSADRVTRRRAERETWPVEPVIRVVELRRKEQPDRAAPVEPVEREWSCQWVVRGHWRQQPYPKVGDVRPKWITPYVKGPDDKPLKPPRATVFAVVR